MKNNTNSIWLMTIHPRPTLAIKRKEKKRENNSPSDEEAEYTARYQKISEMQKAKLTFPRFLLMMSGDEDKSLSRLSTFAIQKGIEGLVGEPKNIKRLRSGDLLIEVDRETFSTKLLAIKHIAGIPVKVSPHRTLNTSKGVIRTQEIKNTTNEELKTQVSDAKIITIRKNGDIIKLNTAVLTFNFPKPPADIKVGFELCTVQLYIPHPLRCFQVPTIWTPPGRLQERACLWTLWSIDGSPGLLLHLSNKMCQLWWEPHSLFQRLPPMENGERNPTCPNGTEDFFPRSS